MSILQLFFYKNSINFIQKFCFFIVTQPKPKKTPSLPYSEARNYLDARGTVGAGLPRGNTKQKHPYERAMWGCYREVSTYFRFLL